MKTYSATPKHRADVPVDSCSFGEPDVPCQACATFPGGRHLDRAALLDEGRAS